MRLRKVEISDFGGFPQTEVIELGKEGKSLLIYGENGSGKSTIFNALDRFFQSSLHNTPIIRFRNLFLKKADPFRPLDVHVKLLLGPLVAGEVQDIPANTFEWTDGSIPTGAAVIRSTAQLPSRLDYRAVLSTHFIHRTAQHVNLYELVVTSLLPGLANTVSNTPFGVERVAISDQVAQIRSEVAEAVRDAMVVNLQNTLRDHGDGLEQLCRTIQNDVRRLLRFIKDGQSVTFIVVPGSYDDATDRLALPQVRLSARLHKKNIPSHHLVINEARLTATGLCIYLAALTHQATTLSGLGTSYLKPLVLDDVLIGLDIANRYPVLGILRKEFADWQIVLLTHDRIWFDMVVETIDVENWQVYEVFKSFDVTAGFDRPKLVPRLKGATKTKDHLILRANVLLTANDFRGAAVYARAAFEVWAKNKANKNLNVKYYQEPWRQPINDLWTAIKGTVLASDASKQAKILALETSKAIVLNPWSHASGSMVVASDVLAAIDAVRDLW